MKPSPFVRLIQSNDPTSDENLNSIFSHIAPYESRLAEIDALMDERAALRAYVDTHRGLASPLRRLPTELLETLFIACLPEKHNALLAMTECPLLLTHVCRRWRTVALALPRLWCSLHVPIVYLMYCEGRRRLLRQWLERSRELPLSLSVRGVQPGSGLEEDEDEWVDENGCMTTGSKAAFRIVAKHTHRARRLELTHIDASDLEAQGSLPIDIANLEHLALNDLNSRWSSSTPFLPCVQGPSLRALVVVGYSPLLVETLPLWSRCLVSVKLASLNTAEPQPTLALVFEILGELPQLRVLEANVNYDRTGLEGMPDTVRAPCLRTLAVLNDSTIATELLARLLTVLDCPELVSLTLPTDRSDIAEIPFSAFSVLGCRSPKLRELCTAPWFLPSDHMYGVLRLFPRIESLIFRCRIWDDDDSHSCVVNVINVLGDDIASGSFSWPNLHTVVLEDCQDVPTHLWIDFLKLNSTAKTALRRFSMTLDCEAPWRSRPLDLGPFLDAGIQVEVTYLGALGPSPFLGVEESTD
ncbi:unnamed protein product [Mycena citricolor]|uniref:F-box domain-containing protein n=1 Tax=Mycena citricolor TaxID=2018698 RepID=A0AAD2H8E3_9AGAR|nr:unnamed protein product [Mycena citricolor]